MVFFDCQESGKTVSAKYYRFSCFKPAIKKVREERPPRIEKRENFSPNAKTNVAKIVKDYINNEDIKIIDHPPYSPDLSLLELN